MSLPKSYIHFASSSMGLLRKCCSDTVMRRHNSTPVSRFPPIGVGDRSCGLLKGPCLTTGASILMKLRNVLAGGLIHITEIEAVMRLPIA